MRTCEVREEIERKIEEGNLGSVVFGIVPGLLEKIDQLEESNKLMEKALDRKN